MAVTTRGERPVVLVRAGCSPGDERLPEAEARQAAQRDVAVGVDVGHETGSLPGFASEAARCRNAGLRVLSARRLPDLHTTNAQTRRDAEWARAATLDPWREKYPTVPVRARAVEGRPTHHILEGAREAGLLVIGR
ncbi:hypothetical protein [Streptomyces sp. NPDC006691]|uniref:hypothetical protein n=1 Tax=Streptomyces sp. NPDC006691 TaxID=3364757 RepID=UPI0036BA1E58